MQRGRTGESAPITRTARSGQGRQDQGSSLQTPADPPPANSRQHVPGAAPEHEYGMALRAGHCLLRALVGLSMEDNGRRGGPGDGKQRESVESAPAHRSREQIQVVRARWLMDISQQRGRAGQAVQQAECHC